MSVRWFALTAMAASLSLAACAVKGNDTGGIISWTPDWKDTAPALAEQHCARFGKGARLSGVQPEYGGYISFACRWDPKSRI